PMEKLNRLPSAGGTLWIYLGIVAAVSLLGTWAADFAEKYHAEKDPHKVVIDEIAGFFVSMFLVPWNWPCVAAAFFLFRFFDVWKPYPIRGLQRLPGGIGIMIDDLLAGVYTCVLIHAGLWIWATGFENSHMPVFRRPSPRIPTAAAARFECKKQQEDSHAETWDMQVWRMQRKREKRGREAVATKSARCAKPAIF
ncbi:phosphatidylglycerophosphatase A, partial [Candidatus Sumerlaeota bacterium]|nr:phosphatidylglycerophosphatase A [Candidatus Sumerlaeota bacterium]